MLFEQRVGGEVGSVTTRGENDGSVLFVLLTVLLVLYSNYLLAILQDLRDLGLFEDLDTIRRALGEILELTGLAGSNRGKEVAAHLFHQGVSDGHTRELGTSSMCSFLRVPTQSRDFREIKIESLN